MPVLAAAPAPVYQLVRASGHPEVYLTDGAVRWHVPNTTVLAAITTLYGLTIQLTAQVSVLPEVSGTFASIVPLHISV